MSEFLKTSRQREAIETLKQFIYAALYGGSRSGKTFIIIYAILVRASKVKSKHVTVRKTFNSAKRFIWNDTLPKVLSICFPNVPVHWNKTDHFITLPNGSEYHVMGMEDQKRVEKILGGEYSTIHFNEASELDYFAIQVVLSRLAELNPLVKKAFFDFNPPAKSHWSYWLFIKKLNPIDNEPLKNPDEYGHLLMNPKDNIDNIDPNYLSILENMPEKEKARFLEGEFADASDGQAYYEFARETHVQSCARTPGSVLIGMDFNVHPMTAVVGQFIGKVFYIFDEVYQENSDTFRMAAELSSKKYEGSNIYPDSTGKNRKTSGISDFQILEDNGFRIKGVTNPFVNDRVNNLNRLFKANRIIIDPKCRKLINDLEKVSWKDNKLDQKSDPMLTHISDCLGYLCWALDNGLTSSLPKNFSFNQRRGRR